MTDALRTSRARVAAATGLAALSAVLVLVATRHGPGVSPDSVQYVASAGGASPPPAAARSPPGLRDCPRSWRSACTWGSSRAPPPAR